jgi:hypothetical protein
MMGFAALNPFYQFRPDAAERVGVAVAGRRLPEFAWQSLQRDGRYRPHAMRTPYSLQAWITSSSDQSLKRCLPMRGQHRGEPLDYPVDA